MAESLCIITYRCYHSTILAPRYYQSVKRFHKDQGQTTKLVPGRWHRFWHSRWGPISTGVGVSVLAVLQWHRMHRERDHPMGPISKEVMITCYRSLPLRMWSRTWGWLCSSHVPKPLRSMVYGLFSSMTGINVKEMAGSYEDYTSLAQFFTRKLKKGARPINHEDCIVSPADGRVLNSGRIHTCHVEQVKGVTYNLKTFFGDLTWMSESGDGPDKGTDENDNQVVKNKNSIYGIPDPGECLMESWDSYKSKLLTNPQNALYQAVIYLSPADYHRFHSPVQWTVNFRRHYQGELMSVNPLIAGWLPGLYSLNERVVYFGKWKHGFFSMTAVGATSVGSIKVYSDKDLTTNRFKWRDGTQSEDKVMNGLRWKKGEEVGEFRFGSTLVLVFEAPKNYKFDLCPQQKVRVGEGLSGCKI